MIAQFSHVHVSENAGMQTELIPRQAVVIVFVELCRQPSRRCANGAERLPTRQSERQRLINQSQLLPAVVDLR